MTFCYYDCTVFGFVEPTFTASERVDPYSVQLAFFSGMSTMGAFRIFFTFMAGTASEQK